MENTHKNSLRHLILSLFPEARRDINKLLISIDAYNQFIEHSNHIKQSWVNMVYLHLSICFLIASTVSPLPYAFSFFRQKRDKAKYLFVANHNSKNMWIDVPINKRFYILDSPFNNLFVCTLPLMAAKPILRFYLQIIFNHSRDQQQSVFVNLLFLRFFIKQVALGTYLGRLPQAKHIDVCAYTTNSIRYLALKRQDNSKTSTAIQIHASSTEPMMSLFEADTIYAFSPGSSKDYRTTFSDLSEVPVGSIHLSRRFSSESPTTLFTTKHKSILILLGNTLHPKGHYYGSDHNQIYRTYLQHLADCSSRFTDLRFFYLEHSNVKSNYEADILANTSVQRLDPSTDVYQAAFQSDMVISYSSAVIPELASYHPHAYIYRPFSLTPFYGSRHYGQNITSFEQLLQVISCVQIEQPKDNIKPQKPIPSYESYLRILAAAIVS